jgi:hypothetical protein
VSINTKQENEIEKMIDIKERVLLTEQEITELKDVKSTKIEVRKAIEKYDKMLRDHDVYL